MRRNSWNQQTGPPSIADKHCIFTPRWIAERLGWIKLLGWNFGAPPDRSARQRSYRVHHRQEALQAYTLIKTEGWATAGYCLPG